MPATLPLFPLGTVLFPGQPLPLHVFEPRYRQLVGELLALPNDAPRRFGVVTIRRGQEVGTGLPEVYEVGCTAELRTVHAHPDGRYDIATEGGVRFRIGPIDTGGPYLVSTVELLAEPKGGDADRWATAARGAYDGYADVLSGLGVEAREPRSLPADPIALSYAVAAAMALDVAERQALLAAPDAAARLRHAYALLRRETALVRTLRAVPGTATYPPPLPN